MDTRGGASAPLLRRLREHGFAGLLRYVPLPGQRAGGDVDAAEVEAIAGAGLGLLIAQRVRPAPWDPRRHSGVDDALAAVEVAAAAGYAAGAHLFLTFEGIVPGTCAAARAFAEGWASIVLDAGFQAGCYVGFDVPLSSIELFDLRFFNSYGRSRGPRRVAVRGFALEREEEIVLDGRAVDPHTVHPDEQGDTPFWSIFDVT